MTLADIESGGRTSPPAGISTALAASSSVAILFLALDVRGNIGNQSWQIGKLQFVQQFLYNNY
jgi:hypothetical protein